MAEIGIEVTKDDTQETIQEMKKRIQLALLSVGSIAINYAKDQTPVDTGRLRNSLTYATATEQGGMNDSAGESAEASDFELHGTPDDNIVVIGTNVEYAIYQEDKHHYLRDAAGNHTSEYSSLIKDILDE